MRVLIVEDDLTIANFLMKGFKEGGFAVDHAGDGETGAHMASTVPYDVAGLEQGAPVTFCQLKAPIPTIWAKLRNFS